MINLLIEKGKQERGRNNPQEQTNKNKINFINKISIFNHKNLLKLTLSCLSVWLKKLLILKRFKEVYFLIDV